MKEYYEPMLAIANEHIGVLQPTVFTAAYLYNATCAKITRNFMTYQEIAAEWEEHHRDNCKLFMNGLNEIVPFNKAKACITAMNLFNTRADVFMYTNCVFNVTDERVRVERSRRQNAPEVDTSYMPDEQILQLRKDVEFEEEMKHRRYNIACSLPLPDFSTKLKDTITGNSMSGWGSILNGIVTPTISVLANVKYDTPEFTPITTLISNYTETVCNLS